MNHLQRNVNLLKTSIDNYKQSKSQQGLWESSYYNIENNTCARVDMEFLFECSTRYLRSERSERVRYQVEHERRNSISTSAHVVVFFFYYNNIPMTTFLTIFRRFPKIFSKLFRGPDERFRTFSFPLSRGPFPGVR